MIYICDADAEIERRGIDLEKMEEEIWDIFK